MNAQLTVYSVGRGSSKFTPDILIPKNENTVGRFHLNITLMEDGRYFLNDIKTNNGTFIWKDENW
ncbi:MAG: FHA domain-containing protein, partial [Verrucomicrobiota bacterium]